jgi:hypothetical protein
VSGQLPGATLVVGAAGVGGCVVGSSPAGVGAGVVVPEGLPSPSVPAGGRDVGSGVGDVVGAGAVVVGAVVAGGSAGAVVAGVCSVVPPVAGAVGRSGGRT